MTDVSALIAWLRAQLDDDERVARQLIASPGGVYLEAETDETDLKAAGAHVFRWSPKRVLAEVDAKRSILDLTTFDSEFPDYSGGYDSACEDVLHLLALPYADRPGYQERWKS